MLILLFALYSFVCSSRQACLFVCSLFLSSPSFIGVRSFCSLSHSFVCSLFFCLLSILLFALYSFVCSLFFCSLSLSFLLHRTSLLRDEVRSNARALHCTHVFGYRESSTICKDVCVLSAIGTAVCLSKVRVWLCFLRSRFALFAHSFIPPPLSKPRHGWRAASRAAPHRRERSASFDFVNAARAREEGRHSGSGSAHSAL